MAKMPVVKIGHSEVTLMVTHSIYYILTRHVYLTILVPWRIREIPSRQASSFAFVAEPKWFNWPISIISLLLLLFWCLARQLDL